MGEKIAKKIDEILETGQLQKLEKVSVANAIRESSFRALLVIDSIAGIGCITWLVLQNLLPTCRDYLALEGAAKWTLEVFFLDLEHCEHDWPCLHAPCAAPDAN